MDADDRLGRQIAEAHARNKGGQAPDPAQVAELLVRNLFDRGHQRLSGLARSVAIQMLTAGLSLWKDQLLAKDMTELNEYKKQYKDNKEELENLKLQVAVWMKEGKV